jgi:hypothetical protein
MSIGSEWACMHVHIDQVPDPPLHTYINAVHAKELANLKQKAIVIAPLC